MSTVQQFNQLANIPGLQELSHAEAAAVQGGVVKGFYGFDRYRDVKSIVSAHSKIPVLTTSNDRISKIVIVSGEWDVYEHANYQGLSRKLGKGVHILTGFWDNRISSFKRRDP